MKNEPLYRFIAQVATDTRLCSVHLCLFAAIAYLGKDSKPGEQFRISRKEAMRYSGIRSIATYHTRLKELIRYGYIIYQPSYDPFRASQILFTI